jgi:CHAT domain-containing protein/tetratricopeptide (TPR) repeat protein
MKQIVVGLLLVFACGYPAVAAEDPPKLLTPQERKELETKWREQMSTGDQHHKAGRLPQAAEWWGKGLATARRLYPQQDHPMLAMSLNNVAGMLRQQMKYADAEPLLREELAMNRRLYAKQDHPILGRSLTNLAGLLEECGKYADAEVLHQEALALHRRLYRQQDHPLLAASLQGMASALQNRRKYTDAESHFREALAMLRRLVAGQDHPRLSATLTELALMLKDQGRYADAEPLLGEALEMDRRLYRFQDHPHLANCLNNLGALFREQGKLADAEGLHREALALRRRLYPQRDHPFLAYSLNNLAMILLEQGKYADAEACAREALELYRRVDALKDHPGFANCLMHLGGVLRTQGKYSQAEMSWREALEMYGRLDPQQDQKLVAMCRFNLALALQDQGKYAEAEPGFREALALFRALAAAYAAERSEGDALTLAATYPGVRDWLLANAQARRAEPAKVYAEVWSSKAALTRIYEQRALAQRLAATDPATAGLLDQLADRRRRRADLLLSPRPVDPATLKKRYEDLDDFTQHIHALERDLRRLLPAVERTEKLASANPTDLQKVLPADAALVDFLHYSRTEPDSSKPGIPKAKRIDGYLAFVFTRNRVAWIDLGPARPIDHAVAAWRESITGSKDSLPAQAAKVRELTWAKVRAEIPAGVRVVYICPDLALCRVPWGALPGDKANTILLEDYAVAVVPHAPFLLDKLWPQEVAAHRPTSVLAIGGVAYDADEPPPLAAKRGEPLLKSRQHLQWTALPGAVAEAKGVATAAGTKKLPTRTLDGARATVSAALAALPQARYAHVATHGFFADASFRSAFRLDPRIFERTQRGERIGAGALSPMVMTGLVFAGANKPETPGRGIITGEALVDLDLSGLELAVLSACETGLGDVAGGEGTFGLQRAFHLAGTRDVIASLWKVPDRPTAALMALFYRNLWEKDLPPIEALRQAQLEIYRHPDRIAVLAADFRGKFAEVPASADAPLPMSADGKAHPRLWAAFTLSGPGTAVSFAPAGSK